MPTHKYTYRGSAKTAWFYKFNLPGSTRENRQIIRRWGFATKHEAEDAERKRYAEEEEKRELAKAGSGVAAPIPTTLEMLLQEFFRQHAQEKLASKTVERYHEQAAYLSPDLLAMPIAQISPLHLNREWARLLKSGGHTRRDKTPRPLSAKTVRHIAGVVSSAFGRAIRWGLVAVNPVTNSEPPRVQKHLVTALLPSEQMSIIDSASGPWCLPIFLEMAAATGCRRGEVLALRWSDIVGGVATVARSLAQTRAGLEFKCVKNERPRLVELPESMVLHLDAHRRRQDEFRRQFGADYQAGDLIFANVDGSPLRPDSISAAVSLLCQRLGLPKGSSLHSLRHAHASLLLADGVPLPVVSARLGHTSIRTTADIYSHALRGSDHGAACVWDEAMRRQGGSREEPTGVN